MTIERPPSWPFSSDIFCIAKFAVATAAAMPFSASARSDCRSSVTLLSVCARTCEPLSTTLRAAAESGLVTNVWTALVKLANTDSSELDELGSP